MNDPTVRLTEIFFSVQGESSYVGIPTVFIRLTGCPLRCVYCDSAYAFEGGSKWLVSEILQKVAEYPTRHICVTGGEPLAQPTCIDLLQALVAKNYNISLETSGAMPIDEVPAEVARILDLKTPSSGEMSKNLWDNIRLLTDRDEVKFVIGDKQDMVWAASKVLEYDLCRRVNAVLFSPVHGQYPLHEFAEDLMSTGLPVRMQVQLHKHIWGDVPGH